MNNGKKKEKKKKIKKDKRKDSVQDEEEEEDQVPSMLVSLNAEMPEGVELSDGDDNDELGCPCSRQDKHRQRHRSPPCSAHCSHKPQCKGSLEEEEEEVEIFDKYSLRHQ